MTSFYFHGLRKYFLGISLRLEVLLAALFISVSNRYQKKTIYLLLATGLKGYFNEEIRTKQDLSYISIYSLSILYNSKFILMATSLGTNVVVVTRVHCITV